MLKINPYNYKKKLAEAETLMMLKRRFKGVKFIIIDEISMLQASHLYSIDMRLREITGITDQPFGRMHV